jgi:hypothetical protein
MFKIQVQEDEKDPNLWQDVKGADGTVLTLKSDGEARARMETLYPVLVKMEHYAYRASSYPSSFVADFEAACADAQTAPGIPRKISPHAWRSRACACKSGRHGTTPA